MIQAFCLRMKNLAVRGGLDHVTLFEIFGPLYIFGRVKDSNFVFGTYIEHNKY